MRWYTKKMKRYIDLRLLRSVENKGEIDYDYLSTHKDLTLEVLKAYPNAPWDWDCIQDVPRMNLEWLQAFPDANWDWSNLEWSKNFDVSWMVAFKHKDWDWSHMHMSEKFDFSWVFLVPDVTWNWDKLSEMAKLEHVAANPNLPWVWATVTAYANITAVQMMQHLYLPWDVSTIRFDSVTADEIGFLRYFNNDFSNGAWIDHTIHTPWNLIKLNADLRWDKYHIKFKDGDITESDIDFIMSFNHLDWNWENLSCFVPFSVIRKYQDLPWVNEMLSFNNSLTYNDVVECPNMGWDYCMVPCEPEDMALKKWVSASIIKRAWRNAICNPKYAMCKRRLQKEAQEYLSYISDL